MPELIEVESYRTTAERLIGRTISGVEMVDSWMGRGLDRQAVGAALVGTQFVGAERIGKVLLLATDGGCTLGLRFGMTGRLLVDDTGPIEALEYGPSNDERRWERLVISLADGGSLVLDDPRRLGRIELDPDICDLGPDAATLSAARLRSARSRRSGPIKGVLLDQRRIAGIGNLIADDVFFHTSIAPDRAADDLAPPDDVRLASAIRSSIRRLTANGGSHTGVLQSQRRSLGACPRCGGHLVRRQVAGRTSVWCARHQR